jgi:hypothetical protein
MADERRFANTLSTAAGPESLLARAPLAARAQPFQPLPPPTGTAPFRLPLDDVLPAPRIREIEAAGKLVFHMAGDTGGFQSPQPQRIVAMHMEQDFAAGNPGDRPSFFYHLGDLVYHYGEAVNYSPQFYDPYQHYPAPIFAIPGNHDGNVHDPGVASLDAFVRNLCAPAPQHTADAGDAVRDAMTQPNVYWTLEAPFVTIVGLYTNVPEGGQLDDAQIAWFANELHEAPAGKAVIVAMHHPIYSLDDEHGSSAYMAGVLDGAVQQTGRMPDLVCSGHAHSYQRFTRTTQGRQIPFLVAGAGGFWNLHYLMGHSESIPTPFPVPGTDATLEGYKDDRHGYLRLEVGPHTIKGDYFSVPRPQESWHGPAERVDGFTLDLAQHRLIP